MNKNIGTFAGATLVTGASMVAVTAQANYRTFPGNACTKTTSGSTVTFSCPINNERNDTVRGASSVYVDYCRSTSMATSISACRQPYLGGAIDCEAATSVAAGSGCTDQGLGNIGPTNEGNEYWDYYSVKLTYTTVAGSSVSMIGVGVSTAAP